MTFRRDFLSMTAGAVAAKTVLPMAAKAEKLRQDGAVLTPHPDAALLAALSEFDAIEHHFLSLYDRRHSRYIEDDDDRDAVVVSLNEAQQPSLERVCSLPARTLEGILARVRTIVLQDAELNPAVDAVTEGYANDRLMAALLRDLLAMGSAADV